MKKYGIVILFPILPVLLAFINAGGLPFEVTAVASDYGLHSNTSFSNDINQAGSEIERYAVNFQPGSTAQQGLQKTPGHFSTGNPNLVIDALYAAATPSAAVELFDNNYLSHNYPSHNFW